MIAWMMLYLRMIGNTAAHVLKPAQADPCLNEHTVLKDFSAGNNIPLEND